MPKLSIIIVSYNVKYFLDQLIQSIQKSKTDFNYEIIVVDNNSPDHSADYILDKFEDIKIIANADNIGYAAANNQGIKESKGKYVLLLNPDTLLQQDTLQKTVDFLDQTPDAGSVGVKMIDGSGVFLPESKRGLPTPWVSFSKILGLHKIFKRSEKFNSYYLGHLDSDQINEVDVLTGAFILIRREVLLEIGGLDEAYFMYGEDIDLSYKIQKSGFKNYYLPTTQIIHYKGESTNSQSFSRNVNFYKAMLLFAQTHLMKDWSLIKKWIVQIGIIIAAVIGYGVKKSSAIFPFIMEWIVFYFGIICIKNLWAITIYNDINYYDTTFNTLNAPLYAVIWLLALIFSGSYDKYPKWKYTILGGVLGLIVVLIIYALLPYTYRSSRPIIFISFIWILSSTLVIRTIWSYIVLGKGLSLWGVESNVLIFGRSEEVRRAHNLFLDLNQQSNRIDHYSIDDEDDPNLLTFKLTRMIEDKSIDDLIICSKGFDFNYIIGLMSSIKSRVKFRLLPEFSSSIIGSSSSRGKGEIYTLEINFGILRPVQKRLKRLFDISVFILLLLAFPIFIYFIISRKVRWADLGHIISGNFSWVGYDRKDVSIKELPRLKNGVFPITSLYKIPLDQEGVHQINRSYALNYSVMDDIRVLISSFKL